MKRGGCSPWKKGLVALKDKEDKDVEGLEGMDVEGMDVEDKVAGKAKESSPPSPPQSTEAFSESA